VDSFSSLSLALSLSPSPGYQWKGPADEITGTQANLFTHCKWGKTTTSIAEVKEDVVRASVTAALHTRLSSHV